jgi:hypothetical protein
MKGIWASEHATHELGSSALMSAADVKRD